MEPMERTHPEENHTILMMHEACRRGHEVYHYEPEHITLVDGTPVAPLKRVSVDVSKTPHYTLSDDAEHTALVELDIIHIRQDPPFDMAYITNTYYLETISEHVLVVNDPSVIRDFPEKLFPLYFPSYVPPTLITRDAEALTSFLHEHPHSVIKPLYDFHGYGVFELRIDDANANGLIEFMINRTKDPIIIQPFIPEVISEGNKRVVFFDGEIAGAIVTKPKQGDFRIYRGSTDHAYELNAEEKEMCETLGDIFRQYNIMFAAIDLIGPYLTEINLTSPGSLQRMKRIYNHAFEADLWDAVEAKRAEMLGEDDE